MPPFRRASLSTSQSPTPPVYSDLGVGQREFYICTAVTGLVGDELPEDHPDEGR